MSFPRLLGIGVGPGDPDLITVKALRALESCDAVLVPSTEASGDNAGRAETIILAACPEIADKIVRVPFTMKDPTGVTTRRMTNWQTSAAVAVEKIQSGATKIGFATIGDPSVYSTFSYLVASVREQVDVEVEVIPGITAMQALAAASKTPLCEGDEVLALVPLKKGIKQLIEVSKLADTCVVYKAGRHFAALKQHLGEVGEDAVVGSNIGLPDEQISTVSKLDEAPYFTSVLWPPKRNELGDRL